jgi:CheY-like chemotaxis protein
MRLSLRRVALADAQCTACQDPIEGEFIQLEAADSGPGVPDALLGRIFDPFFSTKAPGQGSGMGLATVHGIVHEHGGHILVGNRPEGGASFRVLLPVLGYSVSRRGATRAGADEAANSRVARSRLPRARLLLVEDDETAREFMAEVLGRAGLEVVAYPDPLTALVAMVGAPAPAVALLDYTMPHMNGVELACRLREHHPELPVVLYSGYASDLAPAALETAGVAAVLRKPVDHAGLLETLEALLSSRH